MNCLYYSIRIFSFVALFFFLSFFFEFFSSPQRLTTAQHFFSGRLKCTCCGWRGVHRRVICSSVDDSAAIDGWELTESGQGRQKAKIQQRFNEKLMNAKLSSKCCLPRIAFPILSLLHLWFSGTLAVTLPYLTCNLFLLVQCNQREQPTYSYSSIICSCLLCIFRLR